MIYPTKHEDLKQNLLVLGSEVLRSIRHRPIDIETMFQVLKKDLSQITLDAIYDTLTFLWLLDFITLEDGLISIKRNPDVSEANLF